MQTRENLEPSHTPLDILQPYSMIMKAAFTALADIYALHVDLGVQRNGRPRFYAADRYVYILQYQYQDCNLFKLPLN